MCLAGPQQRSAQSIDLIADVAAIDVIVHQAHRLHERVLCMSAATDDGRDWAWRTPCVPGGKQLSGSRGAAEVACVAVGFNTQLRKALDDELSARRRFVALRGAVERFSPNGFNATFANLQQVVSVGDPDNWTPAEIAQAAELLGRSRTHYMQHRARWDDDRRNRKARGLHVPGREDSGTFNDRSWFDEISFSPRGRRRWVRLGEWVRASGVAPSALGSVLAEELRETLKRIPRARFEPMGSMLAHCGPFPSLFGPANVSAIPYRFYNDHIADLEYPALSSRQRLIAEAQERGRLP